MKTLATKITKTTKEFGGWGKAPYLFKFFVFFVAMKAYPHLHSRARFACAKGVRLAERKARTAKRPQGPARGRRAND